MYKIENDYSLEIMGGGFISSGCNAFGAAFAIYQVGVWANAWNAVGQTALVASGIIGGACAIYSFATQ